MYYEVSNVVFNHKPTVWEVQHIGPFKKFVKGKAQTYFLVEDKPENMFKAYSLGFSLKPHAFKVNEGASGKTAFVNTIVLDFDNLTEVQCDFVKAVVNGKYTFIPGMCGDYSSGMKMNLHNNKGIPDYKPSVWKYKVFFPVEDCLSTYEDVYRAFLSAVAFFNPFFPMEEVERVWAAWVKCNNHKTGSITVNDPMFKGWILPDVAMMHSIRTQVTYSCDPEQSEKVKQFDDETIASLLPVGISKFPYTDKFDYAGVDWRSDQMDNGKEGNEAGEVDRRKLEVLTNAIKGRMMELASGRLDKTEITIPTSKDKFAKMLWKVKIEDLVIPPESKFLHTRIFISKLDLTIDLEMMKREFKENARTFLYLALEYRRQGGELRVWDETIDSTLRAMSEIHGMKLYAELERRKWMSTLADTMARSMLKSAVKFKAWRMMQKMKDTTTDPKVLEARDVWRKSRSKEDMKNYLRLRSADVKARMERADEITNPYSYHRQGTKKKMITRALNRQKKLVEVEEWKDWVRSQLNVDCLEGDYSDKVLEKWHEEYRAKWNKTHLDSNRIERKHHKQHKSKWSDMFDGKSKEEIEQTISALDITKQLKSYLRKQYL